MIPPFSTILSVIFVRFGCDLNFILADYQPTMVEALYLYHIHQSDTAERSHPWCPWLSILPLRNLNFALKSIRTFVLLKVIKIAFRHSETVIFRKMMHEILFWRLIYHDTLGIPWVIGRRNFALFSLHNYSAIFDEKWRIFVRASKNNFRHN